MAVSPVAVGAVVVVTPVVGAGADRCGATVWGRVAVVTRRGADGDVETDQAALATLRMTRPPNAAQEIPLPVDTVPGYNARVRSDSCRLDIKGRGGW